MANKSDRRRAPAAAIKHRSDSRDIARDVGNAAPEIASFPIVGIGASAGGLEAFTELLQHLPADTGMAFVLVQHLDPEHESALPQLLGRATSMPVHSVTDKLRVVPDNVYVIPPNVGLVIAQGALRVAPRPRTRAPARSIDRFLESLAEDQQERAIGVILSGTATDGTMGLEAIKAEGGITFAQDDSARYDSMPRSAVAAGCVDFVLSPAQISNELARIAKHPYVTGGDGANVAGPELDRAAATAHEDDATPLPSGGEGSPPTGAEEARAEAQDDKAATAGAAAVASGFKKIMLLLRNHSGVDFSLYKSSTIRRRIARRMVLSKQQGPASYAAFLRGNGKELDALYTDVLISVTSFFRNPEAFDVLKQKVFPKLLAQRGDDPLRVWVLGCSTGQEAYSIAMAFTEATEKASRMRKLQVFATDLNDVLLDKARHGLYAKSLADDIEPERLRRFFVEEQGGYRVVKALREMVVFARQNVVVDPPFSRMDLVSCRNLLIYLEPSLQKKILPVFHYALKPAGFLFLGSSESIGGFTDLFEPIDKKHKIYARKAAATPMFQLAVRKERGDPGERARPGVVLHRGTRAESQTGLPAESSAQREADRVTVNQFAPPGVLVNADLQILQFRGSTAPFLVPPTGKASFDVLKMAREGLMPPLRAAIAKAKKENRTTRKENVRISQNGGSRIVDIEVIPLKNLRERCFLIVFEDAERAGRGAPATGGKAAPRPEPREESRRIAELESTLSDTRDYLQALQEEHEAASEELQASNEEVQSANEELQSVNEELETSKEELESANEELSTINDEMASRNSELQRANSDLANLQNSTRQAVLLLGRDLRVRHFSPQAERQLDLVAADVGRHIGALRVDLVFDPEVAPSSRAGSDAAPRDRQRRGGAKALPGSELERMVEEVIDSVRESEREVRDKSGRYHLLRVRPYLTIDNKVDGAVLVLVDIDDLKRHAHSIAHARDYAQAIVRTVRDPLLILDAKLRVYETNDAFYKMFGLEPGSVRGQLVYELGDGQWNTPRLRALLEDVLPRNSVFNDFEVAHEFETIGRRTMLLNARALAGTDGEPERILLGIEDVTAQREAEGALRRLSTELIDGDRHKNEFLALLAHELRNPLTPIQNALELMRRTLPSPQDPASSRIDMIERQVGHLVRLVDDLLDVSRISRGKIELRREPVELGRVVQEAIDLARPLMAAMDHEFTAALPPESIHVEADAVRLSQIVGNLLSNAAKFTNRGGRIALGVELDGADVVIRVKDNGIGIDKAQLARVFDLFVQVDTSLTRASPGLGIGLGLVKQLVELHGGSVVARSDGLGRGSEFVVRLPIVSAAGPDAPAARTEAPGVGNPHRILAVDDNGEAAESIAALLRMDGHVVRTAADGVDALAAADAFRPHVVLLDIGLPKLSGYEVARRIREQSWGRGIVLIAMTGWGQERDRQKSREAGFDHHLVKPVDFAALGRLLDGMASHERPGD